MSRLIAFALLLNAAFLGIRCSSSSDLSVAEADSPELLARVDELEDAKARDSELLADLQGQIDSLRSDVDALVVAQAINADAIADLAANPASGLSDEQAEMLGHMSIEQLPVDDAGNTAKTIRFSGVNVQVVNGAGRTEELNSLGNLVVGYQELRMLGPGDEEVGRDVTNDRSGSHNIVVGRGNNYSIFAGQVVGERNTISGFYSTVSGGRNNTASGGASAVSGGQENTAEESGSTVSGGLNNTASGTYSTVSGGLNNTASGPDSTVSGGNHHTATGLGQHLPPTDQ